MTKKNVSYIIMFSSVSEVKLMFCYRQISMSFAQVFRNNIT